MIIILFGPPGAGKGTQAELLQQRLQMPHVASGDLFRMHTQQGTPLGLLAKGFMDHGVLVPDDVVIEMIMTRLAEPDCARGVILDGFPRTLPQAAALDETLGEEGKRVDSALYIKVSVPVLLDRLSGRWICPKDQNSYHMVYNPPKHDSVCDICGTPLYQRDDDKRSVAEERLSVYFTQTTPVIDYYHGHGVLTEIDGEQPIEDVTVGLIAAIERSMSADTRTRRETSHKLRATSYE